jgi:hypothetical protein
MEAVANGRHSPEAGGGGVHQTQRVPPPLTCPDSYTGGGGGGVHQTQRVPPPLTCPDSYTGLPRLTLASMSSMTACSRGGRGRGCLWQARGSMRRRARRPAPPQNPATQLPARTRRQPRTCSVSARDSAKEVSPITATTKLNACSRTRHSWQCGGGGGAGACKAGARELCGWALDLPAAPAILPHPPD